MSRVKSRLKEYADLWASYLDEKTDEIDTEKYIQYITRQSEKLISETKETYREEMKEELGKVIDEIKLLIKTREREISVFKSKTDVRRLLTEDTFILREREKEKALKNMSMTLEECRPRLLLHKVTLSLDALESSYVGVNNSIYYRKEALKKLDRLTDALDKCDIDYSNTSQDIKVLKERVILHQKFLTLKPKTQVEKELLVEYMIDNQEHYRKLDEKIESIYEELSRVVNDNTTP